MHINFSSSISRPPLINCCKHIFRSTRMSSVICSFQVTQNAISFSVQKLFLLIGIVACARQFSTINYSGVFTTDEMEKLRSGKSLHVQALLCITKTKLSTSFIPIHFPSKNLNHLSREFHFSFAKNHGYKDKGAQVIAHSHTNHSTFLICTTKSSTNRKCST